MNKIRFEQATELTDGRKKEWNDLWERSPDAHFFNSAGYFLSFIDAFEPKPWKIIFCYDRDKLVAVLPLIRSKKFGISVFACPDRVRNYLDRTALLASKDVAQFIEPLIEYTKKLGNIFLADCPDHLHRIFLTNSNYLQEETTKCPQGKIGANVLVNMSARQGRSMRNKIKLNKKHLRFKYFTGNLDQQLETMIEIERSSGKSQKGIALFDHKDAKKLYRSTIKTSSQNIAVGMLHFDEQPIASVFGLICKNTFLCTHMAFRTEFRNLGPGKILIYFLLEELKKRGVQNFDFSKGDGRLKREFTNKLPAQYNIYFSNNALVMIWWRAIVGIRVILKSIRSVKQSLLGSGT